MNLLFKNYIHVNGVQSEAILALRNCEYIRLNMYNTQTISLQNHTQWMKSLEQNRSKEYFALILNDAVVGSCSWVKDENNIISWGIYFVKTINPIISSLSAYLFMEYLFEVKCFETIDSKVRKNNPLAYSFNQNLGFVLYKEEEDFYCLSLNKEQWKKNNHTRFITSLKKYLGKINYEFQ
jgi:UDP-4-amino-4,6-dideoxy-N-acetyl-beta-L-altrosamine N-acetyltransferase